MHYKKEDDWCNIGATLSVESIINTPVSWPAHHANRHPLPTTPPPKAITALLPIFLEKADTLTMVKHCVDIWYYQISQSWRSVDHSL